MVLPQNIPRFCPLVALSHHISCLIYSNTLLVGFLGATLQFIFNRVVKNILLKLKSAHVPHLLKTFPKTSHLIPSKVRDLTLAPEALQELGPSFPSLPSPLTLSPLTPLQPHWPPASQPCQSTLSSIRSLSSHNDTLSLCMACFLTSFRIKCHFLKEAFPNPAI